MKGGYVDNIGNVISGAINLIFVVAALIAFGFLIFGGVEWIISGGIKGVLDDVPTFKDES